MTPCTVKRPLLSSTSFSYLGHPNTFQQWKAALERVKILYLRGQYKDCISRCSQLIAEANPISLHATILHFYCALSNEAKARLTHPLSTSKIRILDQAKVFYQAAASSLPEIEGILAGDGKSDDGLSSTNSSLDSNESEVLDYYQASPKASGPLNDPSSPSSVESLHISYNSSTVQPAPLRIRKTNSSSFAPTVNHADDQLFCRIFNRPPATPVTTQLPSSPSPFRPLSVTFAPSTSTWLQDCARQRYNAHLITFSEMLTNHIVAVDNLIRTTQQTQAMRYFAKKLASYGEDEAAKEADLMARKAKLKAVGFRRERFRPEKYQELCERALEELGT